MKSIIRVLDDITVNQIAAGEVIENPASVVKELVENSIDAGSTEITIEVKGGGRQLIRITDNGTGMGQDDALLCLERHATSKIHTIEELHETLTMGFRGEAVPSIASISKFTILTNPHETTESGTLIVVEGGKILKVGPAVREKGTTMEVKSLFFNVPVRRKFQKSPAHDAADIQKVVTLLALAHPNISFQYINNEERVFLLTPAKSDDQTNLKQRINELLGNDYLEHSSWLEGNNASFKIYGWIGAPHSHRQNRSGQFIFINKRAVTAPFIGFTLKDAYGTLLPQRRHPTFILYLELPTDTVDVNVHPQKREVRLRKENEIRELLLNTAREALQTHSVEYSPDFIIEPCFHSTTPSYNLEKFVLEEPPLPYERVVEPQIKNDESFSSTREIPQPVKGVPHPITAPPTVQMEIPLPPPLHEAEISIPKVLTTLPGYIIVETSTIKWFQGRSGGISFVDQKAAHNRILFEKLSTNNSDALQIQELLIPHTLELSSNEAKQLKSITPLLQQKGIGVKEFGGNSFIVDALPVILGDVDVHALILDLIHDFTENFDREGENSYFEQKISRSIASAASRASVSKNTKLDLSQAEALLKELIKCKSPHISPTGQPTVARFSEEEIAKQFIK